MSRPVDLGAAPGGLLYGWGAGTDGRLGLAELERLELCVGQRVAGAQFSSGLGRGPGFRWLS
jgi:hypothetical protein